MRVNLGDRSAPVVDYSAAKAQLRLDSDDERDFVVGVVDDATGYFEDELDATLGTRTVTATCYADDVRDSPRGEWSPLHGVYPMRPQVFSLPRGPVQSVTSCTDSTGAAVPYLLERVGNEDRLTLTSRAVLPLTVVYVAGHNPIPGALRRALLSHVADCYESRTPARETPPGRWFERTLDHYRRTPIIG